MRRDGQIAMMQQRIVDLEAELKRETEYGMNMRRIATGLLHHCPIPQCETCAVIVCPEKSPKHFAGDGCTACGYTPEKRNPE